MKKLFFVVAAIIGLSVMSKNADAQALYFYITNGTGLTLNELFVSPAEEENWGDDLLPQDVFEDASTVRVDIPETYGETCMFDIKITDFEGNAVVFYGVDACALHTLTLNDDGTYTAEE